MPPRDDRRLRPCAMPMRGIATLVICLLSAPYASADSSANQRQAGLKYSPLAQINTRNVDDLELAWEYHTGEFKPGSKAFDAFIDEPTLIEGNLVICPPSRRLVALDPATGKQRWIYDSNSKGIGMNKCRGIATWMDAQAPANATCRTRIFLGTADNRLVAIDAKSGKPCAAFGVNGEVKIEASKPTMWPGEVSITSRPAIVNGVVVVGSVVADNQRVEAPSGRVLAFDALTGKQLWEFDPIPRTEADPAMATWLNGSARRHGGSNVWSEMAVDESLDLVYLPTTSPSVDFFGGSPTGRERLRRLGRGIEGVHRRGRVVLPVHASRHLGLRHACAAAARGFTTRRQYCPGTHSKHEDRSDLRLQSQDRRTARAHRGAACAATGRCARRVAVADATLSRRHACRCVSQGHPR